jgi:hypothetical protein
MPEPITRIRLARLDSVDFAKVEILGKIGEKAVGADLRNAIMEQLVVDRMRQLGDPAGDVGIDVHAKGSVHVKG